MFHSNGDKSRTLRERADTGNQPVDSQMLVQGKMTSLLCEESLGPEHPATRTMTDLADDAWTADVRPNSSKMETAKKVHTTLNESDVSLIQSMSKSKPEEIADFIRNMHNAIYMVDVEEEKQFARGKLLGILKTNTD